MPISPLNRVKSINVPLTVASGDSIVTVYQGSNLRSGQDFSPGYKIVSLNRFVKNLKAFAKIISLPEAQLPNFDIEDSESDKLYKVLDIEWNSPRKQLDLMFKIGVGDWNQIGSVSLLNPMGYPFRVYNLMDLFTDNLALECGEDAQLGVRIVNVGFGTLLEGDSVIIHGSYVEEFYLQSNEPPININVSVVGGGEAAPSPDGFLSNNTILDNSYILKN